jgi:hypothetical protein
MRNNRTLWVMAIAITMSSGSIRGQQSAPPAKFAEMPSPAAPNSGEPNLSVAPDGRVFLSWLETVGKTNYLKFAVLGPNNQWGSPQIIARGDNWFVNWADFPSMVVLTDGSLAAHWLAKSGSGTYAYDVNIAFSQDAGKTWSKPVVPHRDGTQTEHGFVSLLPAPGGGLAAIWLDGRKMGSANHEEHGDSAQPKDAERKRDSAQPKDAERKRDSAQPKDAERKRDSAQPKEMTLMYTTIATDGKLGRELLIDGRVCECCQTSAVRTPEGLVVVYRDRSAEEVRDIAISRLMGGTWSRPENLSRNAWEINGCPVNGPAISSNRNYAAAAWFNAPNDLPLVEVALSKDGARTFAKAVRVDDGNPIGRVDVVALSSGGALVSWLEKTDRGAQVRVRRINADGTRLNYIVVSESSTARSSGFPRMELSGNQVVISWTDASNGGKVRTAIMKL